METVQTEEALVAALRAGDEAAFRSLIEMYHAMLVRVARMYVSTQSAAEEVAQETWLAVLEGIDRFEGRSSLKTWITRIVVNIAISKGEREARSIPFSAFASEEGDEPAVDPERFRDQSEAFPGHWRAYPSNWASLPDDALLSRETLDVVTRAIEELPDAQRVVITMRDVAGCSPEEVCSALDVSDGNQRVLLHRARSHVRNALERHLDD